MTVIAGAVLPPLGRARAQPSRLVAVVAAVVLLALGRARGAKPSRVGTGARPKASLDIESEGASRAVP